MRFNFMTSNSMATLSLCSERTLARGVRLWWALALVLVLAPFCQAAPKRSSAVTLQLDKDSARVSVGQDVHVAKGEVVESFVVVGGDAVVDGQVKGDVVVVGGSSKVEGEVTGSLVTVLGGASLGPSSVVSGDMVVVGDGVRMAEGAVVAGEKTTVGLGVPVPPLKSMFNWAARGPMVGRWLPLGVSWPWLAALALLFVYLVLAVLFPRPGAICVDILNQRPVGAFVAGVLLFLLMGPLLLLLTISVVGILVIPFLLCGVAAVVLFGKVAGLRYLGEQVGRQAGGGFLVQPLVAVVLGGFLVLVCYTVPGLGMLVWGLLTPLGAGAVVLAISGAMGKSRAMPAGASAAMVSEIPPIQGGSSTSAGAGVDPLLLPRVGFWRRFFASLLDLFLVAIIAAISQTPITLPLGFVLYHVAMWGWRGTTVGGTILGIKCFRTTGEKLDYGAAAVRSLASIFSFLVFGLGFLWAGWDRDRQSWHDKIAGTMVVRMPRGMSLL